MRGAIELLPVVAADQALLQSTMPDLPAAEERVEVARSRRSAGRARGIADSDESRDGCKQGQQLAAVEIDHAGSVQSRRLLRKGHSHGASRATILTAHAVACLTPDSDSPPGIRGCRASLRIRIRPEPRHSFMLLPSDAAVLRLKAIV